MGCTACIMQYVVIVSHVFCSLIEILLCQWAIFKPKISNLIHFSVRLNIIKFLSEVINYFAICLNRNLIVLNFWIIDLQLWLMNDWQLVKVLTIHDYRVPNSQWDIPNVPFKASPWNTAERDLKNISYECCEMLSSV